MVWELRWGWYDVSARIVNDVVLEVKKPNAVGPFAAYRQMIIECTRMNWKRTLKGKTSVDLEEVRSGIWGL